METAAPAPARQRRGLRRAAWLLACLCIGLPLLGFGLGNAWLGSTSGRGWLAARITAATTLESSIGGASWSPWKGATLRNVRIEQPAALRDATGWPLAEIATLRARPAWLACLRGRLTIAEIELRNPRIVLPVQLLSHFAQSPPETLGNPPSPQPEPATRPEPEPPQPPVAAPAAPTQVNAPPAPSAAGPAVVDRRPTSWIRIRDGSFKLVFAGMETALIEMPEISGDFPIAGGPATARLHTGRMEILGQAALQPLQAPLTWQEPMLGFGPVETDEGDLKIKLAARIARTSGLPLHLEINLPEQVPPTLNIAGGRAGSQRLAADLRFRGLLLSPTTWEADFITRASEVGVMLDGQPSHFGLGGCLAVMRRGVVSCVDARLIGDELSFLANGSILPDGRAAAVLRVVAAPDTALKISSKLFPGIRSAPSFTALSTPQRVAIDLEAFGTLGDLSLRFGHEGPLMEFQDALNQPAASQ